MIGKLSKVLKIWPKMPPNRLFCAIIVPRFVLFMPHLTNRLFILLGSIAALFAAAYPVPLLLPLAKALLAIVVMLVVLDLVLLFVRKPQVTCQRELHPVFSLGDPNAVLLHFENRSRQHLTLEVYDEIPPQFQQRDLRHDVGLPASGAHTIRYELTPFTRGAYSFGHVSTLVASRIGLMQRRLRLAHPVSVDVYPSIVQMRHYELRALRSSTQQLGIKKMRRIGHSYEFEQIKNYVEGDDYRSVNWKASSRHNTLMVNQYEDEKSQQVYCIVDKSRVMKMPFGGLSLMDYAINTALAISNIILKKQDKAGLLTFSDVMGSTIKADRSTAQLQRIMDALYRERERPGEANYELLYEAVRRLVGARSLLVLFTNFESNYALDRVLPTLRRLNAAHLLVVVFFENTEIQELADQPLRRSGDIFKQTVARQFIQDKKEMVARLRQYGIQAILTRPQDLTLNTINKYLELKSRGLI
jgi:uncharacterized protein (DUF58 family)